MKISFSDEEIIDEFSDIIDDLIVDGIYKNERYAISIIKDILSLGVDRYNHDEILYLISQVESVKNSKNFENVNPLCYSSNKKIVKEIININDRKKSFDKSCDYFNTLEDVSDLYDKHVCR